MSKEIKVVGTIPVLKAPSWIQGFLTFIREQGVVGLAVGLTLGLASKGLVDSLVNNLINPFVGLMYGGGGQLGEKFWCLREANGVCINKLGYGSFINQLVNFIIILAVVYFVVKGLRLDRLDKPKDK